MLETVLIIHDDPAYAGVLRSAAMSAGATDLVVTRSVEAGLALLRPVDVVLVDLACDRKPLDAVRRLVRRMREVPVVVIATDAQLESALDAGAADGVTKPLRLGELVARLRGALRRRADQARRAQRERNLTDAIDRLRRENRELERLVCVDSLTGVANRRHALALLDAECKRSARDKLPVSLVIIDLDCFHAFNERYGHLGGDACLQRVSEAMVLSLRRPSDFLGRYGGEEFIAVLPNTNSAGARIVADRLREQVAALAIAHASSQVAARVVTISAGFATLPARGGGSVDALISAADAALMRAKADGRNRIVGEATGIVAARLPAHRWTRFAPVVADPWFADRIPTFLEAVRAEVKRIGEHLAAGELERIRSSARRLRGNAIEYGLDELRRFAADLDHATRGDDETAVAEAAQDILQYVTHVQVVYRRPLEAPIAGPS